MDSCVLHDEKCDIVIWAQCRDCPKVVVNGKENFQQSRLKLSGSPFESDLYENILECSTEDRAHIPIDVTAFRIMFHEKGMRKTCGFCKSLFNSVE